MEIQHATATLEESFAEYGVPEIVNMDQGSQFASTPSTEAMLGGGCAVLRWQGKLARQRVRQAAMAQREARRSV